MQFLTRPFLGAALLAAASCSSGAGPEGPNGTVALLIQEPGRSALSEASAWTLHALDPGWPDKELPSDVDFHGHAILGTATLSDPGAIRRLAVALNAGIKANDGMAAGCFNPRHGISVETPTGNVDLSICFECLQVYVFGPDGKRVETVLTMGDPAAVFNEVYRAAGLTIAD